MNFRKTSKLPLTPPSSFQKTMLHFFATSFSMWSDLPPIFPKIHCFYPPKITEKTAKMVLIIFQIPLGSLVYTITTHSMTFQMSESAQDGRVFSIAAHKLAISHLPCGLTEEGIRNLLPHSAQRHLIDIRLVQVYRVCFCQD